MARRIAGLTLVLISASCGIPTAAVDPTSQAAQRGQDLIVQPSIVFTRNDLRVCFRTPSIPAGDRRVIADAANEWARGTSITFSGFGDCTVPVTNAEIGIIQDESTLFTGRAFGGNPYGAIDLNFTYENWPAGSGPAFCRSSEAFRERCLHATAVHEIGHVLGFAHEQLRPDPLLGLSTCSTQPADGYLSDAYFVGPWDLYSIMNYCNPNSAYGDFSPLSETDKAGAQQQYGRPNFFADIDGDGMADAIVVAGDQVVARFSTGADFGPNVIISSVPFYGSLGTHFADVDGDGMADGIVVNSDGVVVRRSTGRGELAPNEVWSSVPYFGRYGTFFADVTGDGAADAIVANEDGVTVRPADVAGSSFGPNQLWLPATNFTTDGVLLNGTPWPHIPFSTSIELGDVTGDLSPLGKPMADLVLFRNGSARVFRSTGSAFFDTSAATGRTGTPTTFLGNRGTFLADVNGDGRKDAVVINSIGINGAMSGAGIVAKVSAGWMASPVFSLPSPGGSADWIVSTQEYFGERGTYFANVDNVPGDEAIVVNNDHIVVRRMSGTTYGANEIWSGPYYSIVR